MTISINTPTVTKADTAGYKIVLPNTTQTYYVGSWYDDGVVYRDRIAFETGIGICYIPENGFGDVAIIGQKIPLIFSTLLKKYDIQLDSALYDIEGHCGAYTRDDIMQAVIEAVNQNCADITKEQNKEIYCQFIQKLTRDVFNAIDWQCPETYLNEIDIEKCWIDYISCPNA